MGFSVLSGRPAVLSGSPVVLSCFAVVLMILLSSLVVLLSFLVVLLSSLMVLVGSSVLFPGPYVLSGVPLWWSCCRLLFPAIRGLLCCWFVDGRVLDENRSRGRCGCFLGFWLHMVQSTLPRRPEAIGGASRLLVV